MRKRDILELKIRERLKIVLSYLHFLMIFAAAFSLVCFALLGNNMDTFYNKQHETVKYQMEIRKDVQTISKRLLWAIIRENDPSVAEEQRADFKERFAKIRGYIEIIARNLNDEIRSRMLQDAWADIEKDAYYMLELVSANRAGEAADYYDTTFFDVSEVLADALNEVGSQADAEAENKVKASKTAQVLAAILLVAFTLSSLIVGARLSRKLIDSIMIPLNAIRKAAQDIAEGRLFIEIDCAAEDEIGEVAKYLRESVHKVAGYIKDIDESMEKMAGGSFDISQELNFQGDFKNIELSLMNFTDRISLSIYEIGRTVSEVSQGTEQIAKAIQVLSTGSTEQSGIVDTLSDTVRDVTERIQCNARNALDISREVGRVTESIQAENKKMQEVVEAMELINDSSMEIEKIISTINDIASQTNLLALNASIEAARAGESGKGFAVVADQVSVLAGQSAEAAKTTARYIQAALQAVKAGKIAADEAAIRLDGVVSDANAITGRVDNIALVSNEQADAVKLISGDIREINRVLEANAATSQECSAASEELAERAKVLKELVMLIELKKAF